MKRIPVIMIFLSLVLYGKAENPPSDKDKAVACIKRWEGWHRGKMACGTPPFNLNLQVDLEAIFASLYMPFTSPPNSPTQGTCVPPPRRQVAKMGRAPDCPCARKSTPRQSGARPQIPIDMQASDVLAMCQRVRRQIDLGQLRTIDMRVDLRGRYIGMSQDLL